MKIFMAIFAIGLSSCGADDAGSRATTENSGWMLSLSPPTPLDAAQPVLALELTGDPHAQPPKDPILIEGEPTKASAGKYEAGETTDALAERIVPSRYEQSPGRLLLRPRYALATGQRYTLLSRVGVLGGVVVNPASELTYLTRVWPPRDSIEATGQLIYCGARAPTESTSGELFPPGASAKLEPGLDEVGHAAGICLRILPDVADGAEVQPPTHLGDFAFEPSPFRAGVELAEVSPLVCTVPDYGFGPGCLRFEGGSALVQSPATTTLWVLASSLGWHNVVVEGGGKFVVPLAERFAEGRLDALVFDLAGRSSRASAGIEPPEPVPHVVINEVMANPLGPEPSEEWIELLNAGTASATMAGWVLRDQAGDVELPPLLLEPGALVVLVRNDFIGGQMGDIAPPPGTTLVRLTSLGKNGLTNSGEALTLLAADSAIVSRFPARASSQEGVSLARQTPTELDDSAQGFLPHASPGASPGAKNVVE